MGISHGNRGNTVLHIVIEEGGRGSESFSLKIRFSCHSTGCFERESNEKEFKKGKRGKIVATNAIAFILL
jgi:hypothetical protein